MILKKQILIFCGFLLWLTIAHGNMPTALTKAGEQLATSRQALNAQRDAQQKERRAWANTLDTSRATLAELAKDEEFLERALQQQAAKETELTAQLQDEHRRRKRIWQLLLDYRRSLPSRFAPAQMQPFTQTVNGLDEACRDERFLPETMDTLLSMAQQLQRQRWDIYKTDAEALDTNGLVHNGSAWYMGPFAWFISTDSSAAGLLHYTKDHPLPAVESSLQLTPEEQTKLQQGHSVMLPVNMTQEALLLSNEAQHSFWQQLKDGGLVMIPLALVAFISSLLILLKTLDLLMIRPRAERVLPDIIDAVTDNDYKGALRHVKQCGFPARDILTAGIQHADATREDLEELMHERMLSCIPRLERHLGTLAVMGAVAPLLGLLGTVTGMIHTFQLITLFGTGDAQVLSGGIAEALVTTEIGLILAIPILIIHALLARRVRVIMAELEQTAVQFVNSIKV